MLFFTVSLFRFRFLCAQFDVPAATAERSSSPLSPASIRGCEDRKPPYPAFKIRALSWSRNGFGMAWIEMHVTAHSQVKSVHYRPPKQ